MSCYKYRVIQDSRKFGEMVIEYRNGIPLILTQPKTIYSDDQNLIKSWVVDDVERPEKYGLHSEDIPEFVYQLSYMPDGYSLILYMTDESEAMDVMTDCSVFMLRRETGRIAEYLENLNGRLGVAGMEGKHSDGKRADQTSG